MVFSFHTEFTRRSHNLISIFSSTAGRAWWACGTRIVLTFDTVKTIRLCCFSVQIVVFAGTTSRARLHSKKKIRRR
jgi:hypothetical protein